MAEVSMDELKTLVVDMVKRISDLVTMVDAQANRISELEERVDRLGSEQTDPEKLTSKEISAQFGAYHDAYNRRAI